MVQGAWAQTQVADEGLHEAPLWDYTLGGTFKSSDLAKLPGSAGLEPVVGLRYGRWKLGIGDGSE